VTEVGEVVGGLEEVPPVVPLPELAAAVVELVVTGTPPEQAARRAIKTVKPSFNMRSP
jgi:hypothetical protein